MSGLRAEIVLLTADGVGTNEIMRRTAKSRPAFGAGRSALWRTGSTACLVTRRVPRGSSRSRPRRWGVVALTLGDPPGETTHWTGALMAKAAGLSVSSVQRIWLAQWSATAPDAPIRAVQRSALRRQIARRRRAHVAIRPHTPSCCRSTKRARFRRLIAHSPDCR
jgi:hypothetical protein